MTADATRRIRELAGVSYFHNGSPATLLDAVNFYDHRFNLGFTVIPESH